MDVISRIEVVAQPGREVPKPEATEPFLIKGWGRRRGEAALVYSIPNKQGGARYQKGVTVSELKMAYENLFETGRFTRNWFDEHLAACAKEGGCNFTTIGGLFNLIGEARYSHRGEYRKI